MGSLVGARYAASVVHEGKVVAAAVIQEGAPGGVAVRYSVKRDGSERDADDQPAPAWEPWRVVPFSNQPDDASTIDHEANHYGTPDDPSARLLSSVYRSMTATSMAPIRLVSSNGHLYVFRQGADRVLADRFVLDAPTNRLIPTLEVRYRTSRERYRPADDRKDGFDRLASRNWNGDPFLEPTLELGFLGSVSGGRFAVTSVAAAQGAVRWHFATVSDRELVLTSVPASEDGWFELRDRTGEAIVDEVVTLSSPASGRPEISEYHVQREVTAGSNTRLLKIETRLMVVVPTDHNTIAYDFGLHVNGTIAEVSTSEQHSQVNSTTVGVPLAADSLSAASVDGASMSTTAIATIARTDRGDVVVEPAPAGAADGDEIELTATVDVSGPRTVRLIELGRLARRPTRRKNGDVTLVLGGGGLAEAVPPGTNVRVMADGRTPWNATVTAGRAAGHRRLVVAVDSIVDAEAGDRVVLGDEVVTDVARTTLGDIAPGNEIPATGPDEIVGYRAVEGAVRLIVPGHAIPDGQRVVISDAEPEIDGKHRIANARDDRLVLDARWPRQRILVPPSPDAPPSGVSILQGDGYVLLRSPIPADLVHTGSTAELWFRTHTSHGSIMMASNGGLLPTPKWRIEIRDGRVVAEAGHASMRSNVHVDDGRWHRVALSADASAAVLVIDGEGVDDDAHDWRVVAGDHLYLGVGGGGLARTFVGELAEARLWTIARTVDALAMSDGTELTDHDTDLVGNWPLSEVLDGEPRHVVNLATDGADGEVIGAVHPGLAQFTATFDGVEPITGYRNDDLVAVTASAMHRESFEVRRSDGTPMDDAPFDLEYRGRTSRSDPTWTEFSQATGNDIVTGRGAERLDDGWMRCWATFRIPAETEVTLLRAFGIRLRSDHDVADHPTVWQFRNHRLERTTGGLSRVRRVAPPEAFGALPTASTSGGATHDVATVAALEHRLVVIDWAIARNNQRRGDLEHPENLDAELREAELDESIRQSALNAARARHAMEADDPVNWSGPLTLRAEIKGTTRHLTAWERGDPDGDDDRDGDGKNLREFGVEAALDPDASVALERRSTSWELAPLESDPGEPQLVEIRTTIGNNQYRLNVFPARPGSSIPTVTLVDVDASGAPTGEPRWIIDRRDDNSQRAIWPASLYDRADRRALGFSAEKLELRNADLNDGSRPPTTWSISRTTTPMATRVGLRRMAPFGGALNAAAKDLQEATATVSGLRERIRDLATDQDELQREYGELARAWATVSTELGVARRELGTPGHADWMDTELTDRRGLTARATVLSRGSLRGGELRALPEGDLDLVGSDDRGCVVHHTYGTVASSDGAPFERWTLAGRRQCVELYAGDAHVSFDDAPITLPTDPEGWTIELWFFHHPPGPGAATSEVDEHIRLVAGEAGKSHIMITNTPTGPLLGAELPAHGFVACRADLRSLSIGWHHIAVTATGIAADADMQYAIDGRPVGGLRPPDDDAGVDPDARPTYRLDDEIHTLGFADGTRSRVLRLAELRVWGEALGHAALATGAMIEATGREPGLIAHHRLDALAPPGLDVINGALAPFVASVGHPGLTVLCAGEMAFASRDLADAGTIEWWVRFDPSVSSPRIDSLWDGGWSRPLDVALPADGDWHHVAICWSRARTRLTVVVDGAADANRTYAGTDASDRIPTTLACKTVAGLLAEIRVWRLDDEPKTAAEIRANMHRRLPTDTDGLVDGVEPSAMAGVVTSIDNRLPVAFDSVTTCDSVVYDAAERDSPEDADPVTAIPTLERTTVLAHPGRVLMRTGQRIEEVDLEWVGNMQFEPTLLGYIEGAPPVPSENLTVDPPSYADASSVELRSEHRVVRSWNRSEVTGVGVDLSAAFGPRVDADAAVVKAKSTLLGGGSAEWSETSEVGTELDFEQGGSVTDRLSLSGSVETTPHFPVLGARFVPKNVGYAVVASGLADVFITRLRRSGRMISYLVRPVEEAPIDVNTVTFMINPAYTMNGSLDGRTGREPSSDRYFPHLDEMRRRHGSRYPASYFRFDEASALEREISAAERKRVAYLQNFQVTVPERDPIFGAPTEPSDDIGEQLSLVTGLAVALTRGPRQEAHARVARQLWRQRAEEIQAQAAKRDIVNTYVWDADGGLRAESQEFAKTITQHLAGAADLRFAAGFELQGSLSFLGGLGFELTFQRTATMSISMSTTDSTRTGFALDVDLSGVERLGVTDFKDRPVQPGQKVDRYRFKSFYLDGSTDHFDHFFDEVVDPAWLASNDEEARALRSIDRAAPSRPWRVLHRVTYVERPSLLGFGAVDPRRSEPADVQAVATADDIADLRSRIDELHTAIRDLQRATTQSGASAGSTSSDETP